MKLGTLLLRNAAISLTQLEAALRTQVLYGGRLGTNLVELGFLDLDALTAYLAEVTGAPPASHQMFESVDPGLIARFGGDRASRHGAFPLRLVPDHQDDALAVALIDPQDEE